jgi:hypothetical protein
MTQPRAELCSNARMAWAVFALARHEHATQVLALGNILPAWIVPLALGNGRLCFFRGV